MATELLDAAGFQLYINGEVPLDTDIVPDPVALVQVGCEVTLVTVGFGVICKIIYLVVGPKQLPAGDIVKVYDPGVVVDTD